MLSLVYCKYILYMKAYYLIYHQHVKLACKIVCIVFVCAVCRLNLVYLTLLLHGIGTLMPWNMFITAKDVSNLA